MKLFSSLLAIFAFTFSGCAQFTTTPPGIRSPGFKFATNAPFTRFDRDARQFFARAGIINATQRTAVNRLVADLKASGLWTNLLALYPFVGGSSNSCALNLLSTNYTISWQGGMTFNNKGVTGDGTSGYGNTHFNPRAVGVNTNSFHLYVWYSTNGIAPMNRPLIGAQDFAAQNQAIISLDQPGGAINVNGIFTSGSSVAEWASSGNLLVQRSSSSTVQYFSDIVSESVSFPVQNSPNTNVLILSSTGVQFGPANLRAVSVGTAIAPAQVTNYFNVINRFQTALGRGTP